MPREAGKEEALKKLHWLLIPSVFFLDRLVKIRILQTMAVGESIPVWPGVLHWTRVNNTGAAFGLWRDASWALAVFSAISFVLILLYLAGRLGARVSCEWAWALLAGGALGNLYDRVLLGHVIDYVDLRVWPVFNLADACISVGVAWILYKYVSHTA